MEKPYQTQIIIQSGMFLYVFKHVWWESLSKMMFYQQKCRAMCLYIKYKGLLIMASPTVLLMQ